MFFKQFYLGCLAHASYLIGSDGQAAVVDPQRDIDAYLTEATQAGLQIRYVFETHVHADFVSGHRELAERTGATIVVGWRAAATFPHRAAREGDSFDIGKLTFRIIETPGHTPEGISILVSEAAPGSIPKLLTGDTLFIGDVGRPDLAGSKGYSSQQMAGMLYDSLHDKLLKFDDAVELYPAHGAGSLCGRNISSETWSTVGAQRRDNYALQPMPKDEFIAMMTTGLPEQPAYFAVDAELNRRGLPALATIDRPTPFSAKETAQASKDGALLLDVRPSEMYGPEHIPGSLNIGLDGQFASWAGTLIAFDRRVIVITADDAQVDEAVLRLVASGCRRSSVTSRAGSRRGVRPGWRSQGRHRSGSTNWIAVCAPRAICNSSTFAVRASSKGVRRRTQFRYR